MVNSTFKYDSLSNLILLIQGLIVSPLTSISHAPQLPVKQTVGIYIPAFSAFENQSSPSEAYVSILFGHAILILDLFNLVVMKYLNVSQILWQGYLLLILFSFYMILFFCLIQVSFYFFLLN